jgi:hypothetical protein
MREAGLRAVAATSVLTGRLSDLDELARDRPRLVERLEQLPGPEPRPARSRPYPGAA